MPAMGLAADFAEAAPVGGLAAATLPAAALLAGAFVAGALLAGALLTDALLADPLLAPAGALPPVDLPPAAGLFDVGWAGAVLAMGAFAAGALAAGALPDDFVTAGATPRLATLAPPAAAGSDEPFRAGAPGSGLAFDFPGLTADFAMKNGPSAPEAEAP